MQEAKAHVRQEVHPYLQEPVKDSQQSTGTAPEASDASVEAGSKRARKARFFAPVEKAVKGDELSHCESQTLLPFEYDPLK